MKRSWFREKLVDKIVLGTFVSLVGAILFFGYDSVSRNSNLVQKVSDVRISTEKDRFKAFNSVIDDSVIFLTEVAGGTFVRGSEDKEVRKRIISIKSKFRAYISYFENSKNLLEIAVGENHSENNELIKINYNSSLNLKNSMAKCMLVFNSNISLFKLPKRATKKDLSTRDIVNKIEECRNNLLIEFDEHLINLIISQEQKNQKIIIARMSSGFTTPLFWLLSLMAVVLGLIVTVLYYIADDDDADHSEIQPRQRVWLRRRGRLDRAP